MSEVRYVCKRTDNCRCAECEVKWLTKELIALRASNAALREALPSDEDECPCCLTHSCEAFRAYVSRARAAEGEGKG